ncbi:MAG: cytochrome c biogenesis protein CcsA [Armatimonadetes bacterium]|nr:cytochrome c biogenesis protein CcsA [Armatimonadota bacterium]
MNNSMTLLPTPAPAWALQLGEFGKFLVVITCLLFIVSFASLTFLKTSTLASKIGASFFNAGVAGLCSIFAILGTLFVNNQFEFEYVWSHADKSNSWPYQVAGIWSGQEGSFLLWALCAGLFGVLVARNAGEFKKPFLQVYGLFLAALTGILAYESPFNLNLIDGKTIANPADGVGLAPSLQNYWVTIHPPVIFLGFGSLTAVFALAVAALIRRSYTNWIPIVRPWAIISLTLVGLGLCMGGFWAYETLGWGGFWMWDPVENVSFVPWCFMAAFVHGVLVQSARKKWQFTNILLGGLPFLAFVYGTYLTRSGILSETSVHSFAEMDRSALKIMMSILGVTCLGFFGLLIARFIKDRDKKPAETPKVSGTSRENFYRYGIIFLLGLGLATGIGMSVPLFMALSGQKTKVVEEHQYHMVVPWLFVPIMYLLAITPFVSWKSVPMTEIFKKFYTIMCITIGITGTAMLVMVVSPFSKVAELQRVVSFPAGLSVKGLGWVLFLTAMCLLVIVGNTWRLFEVRKAKKLAWGPFVSHIGLAVLMVGLIISRGFERHLTAMVMDGHPGQAFTYAIKYRGMTSNKYDRNNKVIFDIFDAHKGEKPLFSIAPGLYYVKGQDGTENPMIWPDIKRHPYYDFYFTLNPPQSEGTTPIEFKVGDSKTVDQFTITYLGMKREGEAGMGGTKFGAELRVNDGTKTYTITPKLELSLDSSGPVHHDANLDKSIKVSLVSMNAANNSATLQFNLASPIYPVEIYHKPLTIFVWLGTAIMALGGFMSALYRRAPKATSDDSLEPEQGSDENRKGTKKLAPIH